MVCETFISVAATPFSGALFGQGDGPIVADLAVCTGNEGRLSDCMYNLNHRCTHANDAGVRCSAINNSTYMYSIVNMTICYLSLCI